MARVTFSGQLSEGEYRRMQLAALPWLARNFGWLLLGAAAVALATGGYHAVAADPAGEALKAIPLLVLVVVFFVAPRRLIRRQWRASKLLHGPISGAADEEGIEWNTPFSQERYPWSVLHKYRAAPDLVLVYTSLSSALFLPRGFFADEGSWQQFNSLVSAHLSRHPGRETPS